MATLSASEIKTLLVNAGFPANGMDTQSMVGIAFAESGGNPRAHNNKPPDDSYGLWQINMLGSMGPDRRKKFGISSNDALYDPQTNAKAAYVIYKSQGLDAWTTYKSGAYLNHMDGMTTAEGGNKGVSGTIKDLLPDPTKGIGAAIDAVGKNIFKGLSSFIGVIIAIALLGLGVFILVSQSKTAKGVIGTVSNKGVAGAAKKAVT